MNVTAIAVPLAAAEPIRAEHADYGTLDGDPAVLASELRAYGAYDVADTVTHGSEPDCWDRLARLATAGY